MILVNCNVLCYLNEIFRLNLRVWNFTLFFFVAADFVEIGCMLNKTYTYPSGTQKTPSKQTQLQVVLSYCLKIVPEFETLTFSSPYFWGFLLYFAVLRRNLFFLIYISKCSVLVKIIIPSKNDVFRTRFVTHANKRLLLSKVII